MSRARCPARSSTTANGVKIVGHLNVPGRIAASASLLYAKNLFAFLETMVDKATKTLAINRDDELVKATMLTDGGKVVHPNFANARQRRSDRPSTIEPVDDPRQRLWSGAAPKQSGQADGPAKHIEPDAKPAAKKGKA